MTLSIIFTLIVFDLIYSKFQNTPCLSIAPARLAFTEMFQNLPKLPIPHSNTPQLLKSYEKVRVDIKNSELLCFLLQSTSLNFFT